MYWIHFCHYILRPLGSQKSSKSLPRWRFSSCSSTCLFGFDDPSQVGRKITVWDGKKHSLQLFESAQSTLRFSEKSWDMFKVLEKAEETCDPMISFRDGWKTTKTKWWNLSGTLQGPHLSTMHWAGSPDPTEFTIVAHRPPGHGKNIQKTSIHIQWFHIQLQDISVFLPGEKRWGIPNHHSGECCWLHKVIYPILLDIYPWFLHHLRPRNVGRMFDVFPHKIYGYQTRICSIISHI